MSNKKVTTLYRYVRDYDWADEETCELFINCDEFEVIRETDFCYVIKLKGRDKFILKDPYKSAYAYDDKKWAMVNFKKRTESALRHAKRNLNLSKEFLKLIEQHEKA